MEIYIVTANSQICPIIESWSHSVTRFHDMSSLTESLASETYPDAVLLIEGGTGVSPEAAAELKKQYPDQRIIYIADKPDFHNAGILNGFVSMANAGIFDILCSGEIRPSMIRNLIDHPMTAEDVSFLYELKKESDKETNMRDTFVSPAELRNVIAVSSAKPGTGKSFIASNLAVMLAQNGRVKADYNPPKVLLMEMGNGTGTLQKLEHPQYNIREALRRIQAVADEKGQITGNEYAVKQTDDFIRNCCFQAVPEVPNLYSLTSAPADPEKGKAINQYHFFYLMRVLSDMFDVVIVDSDIGPDSEAGEILMKTARELLMAVGDDYDSVRVALGYYKELSGKGTAGKVRYVLNQMPSGSDAERMLFKAEEYVDGKKTVGMIPHLDPAMVYNCLYHGMPAVLDQSYDTLLARIAFTKLADTIWPMENIKQLSDETDQLQKNLR